MRNQDLRDRSGNLKGRVREWSDGLFEIRDASGNLKGRYDERSDRTRDASGNLVGTGNQLTSLLDD